MDEREELALFYIEQTVKKVIQDHLDAWADGIKDTMPTHEELLEEIYHLVMEESDSSIEDMGLLGADWIKKQITETLLKTEEILCSIIDMVRRI